MKKINVLLFCGVIALMLASCSTKQRAISQLESFSTELRDHSRYYDVQDWEKAGKKFVDITKNVKKHDRGAKENITDRLNGFINELKGILQGVTDAFGGW